MVPIEFPQRLTIDKVFLVLGTASGTLRFVMYKDSSDTPQGQTKVFDTGNIGAAARTSATVSASVDPGQYWIGVTCSTSAATIRIGSGVAWTPFVGATFSYRAGSLASNTIAPSDTCPTVTITQTVPVEFFTTVT